MTEMSDRMDQVSQPKEKKPSLVKIAIMLAIIACLFLALVRECTQHSETEQIAEELSRIDSIRTVADAERAATEAAEARLEAEQTERDIHVRIAARARAFTLKTNSVNLSDSARIQARLEMAAWLDSLKTGGKKPEVEENDSEKTKHQEGEK